MIEQKTDLIAIGYSALIKQHELLVIPHFCASFINPTGRGYTFIEQGQEIRVYPQSYTLADPMNSLSQLEFAIKHEGVNLEIISNCFALIKKETITQFIQKTPTGKYARILWFLYEFITGKMLELQDIKNVPYVDLLDCEKYFVANVEKSKRHAVNNNLLGDKEYCPLLRMTDSIKNFIHKDLSAKAKKLIDFVDPSILARATHYLYTKETKSSFSIEKETPDTRRTNKFIALLESAASITQLDKNLLIMLKNNIVEDLYKDIDYRKTQNYVGELTRLYQQRIHYISPKPEDLPLLMEHFLLCETKLFAAKIHPVIIAAILSFGFVFLHPFEDGNGRLHRFIIHYVLSKTGYTPDNIIFCVSSVMLKNLRQYDATLELFSKPLLQAIGEYHLNDEGELMVPHETKKHYQYIDYTSFAEYLFQCIELTIEEDFREELDFITKYDQTKAAIKQIIDMPDLKIDRIIRCIAQNNGVLGNKMRRTYFNNLNDDFVQAIEKVVREKMSLGKSGKDFK